MNLFKKYKLYKIKKLISIINNRYEYINYGGCGIFSYYLHKIIKNIYNIDNEIFYIKCDTPPGGKPDYDIWFSHIIIKIDDKFIDNNGIHSKEWIHFNIIEKLEVKKLEEMINIPELWNDRFDKKGDLVNELESIVTDNLAVRKFR